MLSLMPPKLMPFVPCMHALSKITFIALRAKQKIICRCYGKQGLALFFSNDIYPTSADGTLPFKQSADAFYMSGVDQEETILLLFPGALRKQIGKFYSHLKLVRSLRFGMVPSSLKRRLQTKQALKTFNGLARLNLLFTGLCLRLRYCT